MTKSTEISKAVESGKLLPASADNLAQWLESPSLPEWALQSLDELIKNAKWEELNDRFFQDLAFGTGGMRGRTIGRVATDAEMGADGELNPAHAAIGSNTLNDIIVTRATMGLYRHTRAFLTSVKRDFEVPKLVIAHDVRFFSRHFCELAASVWSQLGGQAYIFDGPRSTPQLSFSVRFLDAHAGIVITASHNPSHDNGYQVYF